METSNAIWTDPADTGREYPPTVGSRMGRACMTRCGGSPPIALDFLEKRKVGGVSTVRKAYTSGTTPTSNQPYISQVETMLEPGTANAKSKRSIHNLDQYGNLILTKRAGVCRSRRDCERRNLRVHDPIARFSFELLRFVAIFGYGSTRGAPDPRQIGIRPTGVYWGGGREQIDMQSGNLNYTLPVVQAKSRGG